MYIRSSYELSIPKIAFHIEQTKKFEGAKKLPCFDKNNYLSKHLTDLFSYRCQPQNLFIIGIMQSINFVCSFSRHNKLKQICFGLIFINISYIFIERILSETHNCHLQLIFNREELTRD